MSLQNVTSVPHIERRIFVGGLPSGITEEEFKQRFEEFGGVQEVVLIYGRVDRKPRGFGFITFDSDEAVQRVTTLRFLLVKEKIVEVKRAKPYTDRTKKANTFETFGLHLASPVTYNPYFNYYFPNNYNPICYPNYSTCYSSCFNRFCPSCSMPYSSFQFPYNHHHHCYEVGDPSATLNGSYFRSPSLVGPSNPSPVNGVQSPPNEAQPAGRFSRGEGERKFINSTKDKPNCSSSGFNIQQNGDDPAQSSKGKGKAKAEENKSEENKSDNGVVSLNCNGGNPSASFNGTSTS